MSCARKRSMNDALMPIEVALKICRRRWLCQERCGETGSSVGSRWETHPRDAAEDVAHVGEEDAADEDESEHARPCSDVELDVQADGDSGQERGEEVGALDRARRELALCAALDRYCRMLMALARVAEDEVDAGLRRAGGETSAQASSRGKDGKRTTTHSKDAPDAVQAEEPPDGEPQPTSPTPASLPHGLPHLEPVHVLHHLPLHLLHRAHLELEALEVRRRRRRRRPPREERLARRRLGLASCRTASEGERAVALLEVEAGPSESALGLRDCRVGDGLAASEAGLRQLGRGTARGEAQGAWTHLDETERHSYASHAVLTAPPPDKDAMRMTPGTQMRERSSLTRPAGA